MNRIVIVGNGFDIAHGCKTSYEAFLLDYFNLAIKIANENDTYEDDFITVDFIVQTTKRIEPEIKSIDQLIKNQVASIRLVRFEDSAVEFTYSEAFRIEVRSEFFDYLLEDKRNWTDIESAYYSFLLKSLKDNGYLGQVVNAVNDEFQKLIDLLLIYLKKIEGEIPSTIISGNLDSVIDKIYLNFNLKLNKIIFLNFNYTSLLSKYLRTNSSNMVHIHGSLSSQESIIFGYCDTDDDDYGQLRNKLESSGLRYLKLNRYPIKDNYQKLMDFISDGNYDVKIIGHSLGLSDKFILKPILQHDNCKKITLFHKYGAQVDSHVNKCAAISKLIDLSYEPQITQKIAPFDSIYSIP